MENMEKIPSPEIPAPPIGIYEHYKSTPEHRRYYRVLGAAEHTETGERFVVYYPIYTTAEGAGNLFNVRPLDMFTENVEHDGEVVPRFRYVGPEL